MNSSTATYYANLNDSNKAIVSDNFSNDRLSIGVFISDFASPFIEKGVTIVVYTCLFVIGLFFNVIVCLVIACGRSMHTTTGCYLFNLAVSDLLLLIVGAPDEAYELLFNFSQVSDGTVECFLRTWAGETSASVSTMIVTVFTVERYLAICHPFVAHVMSDVSRALKLILLIWIIALLSSLPLAWQSHFVTYRSLVDYNWTGSCFFDLRLTTYPMDISTAIFFILPVTIITVLHILIGIKLIGDARMRRKGTNGRHVHLHTEESTNKALKLLGAIVIAFFICWAPVRMQRWMYIHFEDKYDDKYWKGSLLPFYSRIFCLLSSIINPVIYSIMSRKFRDACKDLFVRSTCRKKLCKREGNSNVSESRNGHALYSRTTLTNVDL